MASAPAAAPAKELRISVDVQQRLTVAFADVREKRSTAERTGLEETSTMRRRQSEFTRERREQALEHIDLLLDLVLFSRSP